MLVNWATEKLGIQRPFAPLAPETPLCVIGDIHGRFDLLCEILWHVPIGSRVICVGDYIDRGPDSASVLNLLMERPDIICLQGNHEQMLLKFLKNPSSYGNFWLDHGGLQTLASFGVSNLADIRDPETILQVRDQLLDRMGQALLSWLTCLPTSFQSGNILVTHAGADPRVPIDEQSDSVLQWGHPKFDRLTRKDGHWVVYGHTIVDTPFATRGRIAVDTGAYATGQLTAACIGTADCGFVTVTAR